MLELKLWNLRHRMTLQYLNHRHSFFVYNPRLAFC